MESSDPCPLPLYLVRLLAIAVAAPDLKDETIARLAFLSPETVKKYFSRMFALTDTHDRGTLILTALRQGWIPLPPAASMTGTTRMSPPEDLSVGQVIVTM